MRGSRLRAGVPAVSLVMKERCERCGRALPWDGEAHICSNECTFCAQCTRDLRASCPNCGGELVRRPRRESRPQEPA